MNRGRNVGLDMLRLFAAAGVIVCHSGFFSVGITYRLLSFAGILAVEIFFALSGFLVGRSLLSAVLSNDPGCALKRFYVNRIFRTFPLYYAVLILTALTSGGSIPITCFFFFQNFDAQDLGFLPVSWSLSVEAWFYFLIPPMLLLLVRLFSRRYSAKKSVFISLGLLCAAFCILRIIRSVPTSQNWDFEIRKQILLRLDALLLGVLLSAMKMFVPEQYKAIGQRNECLLLPVAGIAAVYYAYCLPFQEGELLDSSAIGKILLFTLLPLLCCLLVMSVENSTWLNTLGQRLGRRWISHLSILSYGVYLLQFFVFSVVSPYFVQTRFIVSWMGFLAAIGLSILLAQLTYWLIEKPAERLRDRLYECL